MRRSFQLELIVLFTFGAAGLALAQPQGGAGVSAESPDERARRVETEMTDDERLSMIYSLMPVVISLNGGQPVRDPRVPEHIPQLAGWVKGVPRLGVPDLVLTDAGLGVTNPRDARPGDSSTALPSGLALGATFNLALAREAGALVGREARAHGFNVLLGGGMNLPRDPRHGRNFEYLSEDPLLSALMAAENVKGIQSEGVIGMLKHVSLNVHETNKWFLDARIDPAAHRESDLLAFQIAIERAEPGALMCAYQKINGDYACRNKPVLHDAIKDAIGFKGWIMSDWKAVYGWEDALAGLDQHSGVQVDAEEWFIGPLREAFQQGTFPKERLSDMVRRILRSVFAAGVDRWGEAPAVDRAAHHASALEAARQGIVLLKNEDDVLPLGPAARRIALIGGFANVGALTGGGGSSLTVPHGGFALSIPLGGGPPMPAVRRMAFTGPSPLDELRRLLPDAAITYSSGEHVAEAVTAARNADVAVVVAYKYESEGYDSPDLTLPFGQDALIDAVASANPRTVVVLQTGNPVDMPWRDKAKAIVETWYSGSAGGQPMAEVLAGAVNPSGHLPITFVASVEQTPHPELAGYGTPVDTPITVNYHEGAEIGYRWLAKTGAEPLYPFGHGLSYTEFEYSNFRVEGGDTVTARFDVKNVGERAGADVPQVYLTHVAGETRMRLLGFERVTLAPGESKRVTIATDPRLLARFDAASARWQISSGEHTIAVGHSAGDLPLTSAVQLAGRAFGR